IKVERSVPTSRLFVDASQTVSGLGAIGRELHGFLKCRFRLRKLPSTQMEVAKERECRARAPHIVRSQADALAVRVQSPRVITQSLAGETGHDPGFDIPLAPGDLAEVRFRPVDPADGEIPVSDAGIGLD